MVEIHRSSILSLKPLKFDRRYIILEQKIKEKILYIHLYNDNRLTFASQRRKQLFANRRNETNNIFFVANMLQKKIVKIRSQTYTIFEQKKKKEEITIHTTPHERTD